MDTNQTATPAAPATSDADTTRDVAPVAAAISERLVNASLEARKLAARMFAPDGSGLDLVSGMLTKLEEAINAHKGTVTERMVYALGYIAVAREHLNMAHEALGAASLTRTALEALGKDATEADYASQAVYDDSAARCLDQLRGTIALLNGVQPASVQTVNATGKREQHETYTALLRGVRTINGNASRVAPAYVPPSLRGALTKAQAERAQREADRVARIARQQERKQVEAPATPATAEATEASATPTA